MTKVRGVMAGVLDTTTIADLARRGPVDSTQVKTGADGVLYQRA